MIKTLKEFRNSHYFYIFGIDDMAIATVIGAVVAGVASIASSAATNKANKDAVESTNEQNRELTERAWERDDMQLQRSRQDAEKAGFSPLAALSSNLTNTSPATMQAPQYDFSGIGEGVGKIADAPRSAIASKMEQRMHEEQIAGMHEQNRSLSLDNKLKENTYDNNVVKSSMELMRLKKELDGMDLSNYEKASILVANGMKADLAKQIVGTDVNANKSTQANLRNINASTNLLTEQKSFVEAQKNYTNLQHTINSAEFKEWNSDTSRLARLMTNNLAKSLGEYESYLNNTRIKTLKERQMYSIPVSVDSDGKIVYNDKDCTYAEYLVYWEDFVKRSQSYFNEPTNLERSKVILDSIWSGVNSISPFKMPTK